MQPPVALRLVPPRAALGVVARLAAWPLVYAGAYAVAPSGPHALAAALVLASLMASTVAASRTRGLARAGVATAAIAVALPAYAVARALGPIALAIALLAGTTLAGALAATRTRDDAPLDGDARVLAPVAAWIAIAAAVTRFGAEVVHLHRVMPAIAMLEAALATALALAGAVVFVRQRAWTARVYAGEARPLRVAPLPDDASEVRALADVPDADAAIVAALGDDGPYRASGDRTIVARVPSAPGALFASHARALRRAGASAALAIGALVATAGPLPSRAHADEARVSLHPLPAACEAEQPTLRFVALEPLRAASLDTIADHYRRARIADVPPTRALLLQDRFVDSARDQLVAEDVADAARAALQPGPHELVIVVTDQDMYMRTADYRWVFAYRSAGVAVVSVARMDPAFPWLGPTTYRPERAACAADLHARAHKMITRQVLLAACEARTVDDPRSARRATVLSLGDLDAIDESVY